MKFFDGVVLAIETSCDETSVAVLDGPVIKANIISSQIDLHAKWGGVVPEAAARAHVEAFLPVLQEALAASETTLECIKAFAVTNRPGLVGALSVGVSAAVSLSEMLGKPLIGVHHLEGHLWSVLGADPALEPPFVSLLVSGGHTEVILVEGIGQYTVLATTIDDAAGEAFDKSSRLLGLGYPGGLAIQRAAVGGMPRYPLPRALADQPSQFSFSGLKTAVMRLVEKEADALKIADAAASVQEAIVDALVAKTMPALLASGAPCLTLVGGVAANARLRERLQTECDREGKRFLAPPLSLCTDNAAMIGLAGSLRLACGQTSPPSLDVLSSASLQAEGPVEH